MACPLATPWTVGNVIPVYVLIARPKPIAKTSIKQKILSRPRLILVFDLPDDDNKCSSFQNLSDFNRGKAPPGYAWVDF